MMALREQSSGITLRQLLAGMVNVDIPDHLCVNGISIDSRRTELGDLFLACKGAVTDGAKYTQEAIEAGASVIAIDAALKVPDGLDIPVFVVPNLSYKAGLIASRFYENPSHNLDVIGITGTNGKTSVSWWLANLYSRLTGGTCGLIGTLGIGKFPDLDADINTTPDPIRMQKTMSEFVTANLATAFIEASSHALEQGRTNGLRIKIGVFTNLSHEHLDYHKDLQSYRDSKAKLFQHEGMECAVINVDDDSGQELAAELDSRLNVIRYSLMSSSSIQADLYAKIKNDGNEYSTVSLSGSLGDAEFVTNLTGRFNVSNLLAVIAVLSRLGFSFDAVISAIENLSPVPGRMEKFLTPAGAKVFVDYAHTPDALKQALSALKVSCTGRLYCVFGCGGDRDNSKRGMMGVIAGDLADEVIITDDNPRNESPEQIVMDIISGMRSTARFIIEHNRSQAIIHTLSKAASNDVVLIAGKGHETYQQIKNKRYPFSDRQQVRSYIEASL